MENIRTSLLEERQQFQRAVRVKGIGKYERLVYRDQLARIERQLKNLEHGRT